MSDLSFREERKNVTVLFADMSGFTPLSEQLDPEDITAMLNRYFDVIAEIVQSYGGHVHRYIGDAVMVLFGAPVAHEDDPERAVRAALDIMETLAGLDAEAGPVEWHIGINTGLVVAGGVGASVQKEYTVIGDAVNTASRILDAASEGQILVGESVYERTRHAFEFLDVGRLELKGKSDKVAVYEPVRALPVRSRLEIAGERGLTRFVGREAELDTLRTALADAMGGRLRVTTVRGAAGQGKSRLLHEFRSGLDASTTYLHGTCYPFVATSAYQPIVELLRRHWSLDDRSGEQVRTVLPEQLARIGLESRRAAFEDLLELEPTDESYNALTPKQRRTVISASLTDFFRALSEASPTVVALDDLQWADQSSLDLIGTVIEGLAGSPMLLVLLSRPEFVPPWGDDPAVTALELSPLAPAEGADLVQALLSPPPAAELLDYILRWSGGNPFFTEELIRTIVESGALTANGEHRLSRPASELDVPETIQGVIAARMDRLDSGARRVLEAASVIGNSFDVAVLQAIIEVDPDELAVHLDRLAAGEFVDRSPADPAGFAFRHALTREVAYHATLRRTRERTHERVAEAIERLRPEAVQVQPEVLANHYTKAKLPDRAIPLWQQAAQRSLGRSANSEAITQVRAALELLEDVSEDAARARKELELQTTLGVALITTQGFASSEAKDAYARARELGRRVDDPVLLAPALRGLWIFHNMRGDYELARQLALDLLNLSQETGDSGLLLEAHRALGITLLAQGELLGAQREFEHGIGLCDAQEHRDHITLYGQDPLVAYLVQLSWALTMRGEFREALDRAEDAVARARELAHPFSIAGARFMAALAYALVEDPSRTEAHARACAAVSGEHHFGFMLAHGRILVAWAQFEQAGDDSARETALEQIGASLAAYQASGASWILPHYEGRYAAALHEQGRDEEASTVLERAFARVARTGEHVWSPQLLLVRARLGAQPDGRSPAAADDLDAAIEEARRQGSRLFEVMGAATLVRTAVDQTRRAEAMSVVRSVIDGIDPGEAVPVVEQTRALVEQTSEQRSR